VANRTADSPELIAALRGRAMRSPAGFTLLVPAVPYGLAWAADMKAGRPGAASRIESALARMRMSGIEIDDALIGDPDPLAAVGDALLSRDFEEVVVSTLPRGVSRWIRLSLPQRLRRATELPVSHVTAHPRLLTRPPDRHRGRRPSGKGRLKHR
jgi:GABA permease